MGIWSKIVDSFPLTVSEVTRKYRMIPSASDIFYHYTTNAGLEGILRSGGLRATYRMRMNDAGEFDNAKNVVYDALSQVGSRNDLPNVAHSLIIYTRKNLDKFLNNSTEISSSYCACLTASFDHPKQWETYAEEGEGFAIGFRMINLLNNQVSAVRRGESFIFCAPVHYKKSDQHDLVWRLMESGIRDMQTFANTCSQKPQDLSSLRDRVTGEIVIHLIVLIDFLKSPIFSSEREIRLFLDPNDGTLNAPNIQHYDCHNESIPFIFFDLCCPRTKRLPLVEIKIGPKAPFAHSKDFLESLLDELGYGSNYGDRPKITRSLLAKGDKF